MIARLGSSRPEKSRGRYFKSPSFIVFLFYIFFCVVVGGLLLLLKKFQRALFRYCHTHTHDRPLVGGTGRPAFGGQYDL